MGETRNALVASRLRARFDLRWMTVGASARRTAQSARRSRLAFRHAVSHFGLPVRQPCQKKFHWRPAASTKSNPMVLQGITSTKDMGNRTFHYVTIVGCTRCRRMRFHNIDSQSVAAPLDRDQLAISGSSRRVIDCPFESFPSGHANTGKPKLLLPRSRSLPSPIPSCRHVPGQNPKAACPTTRSKSAPENCGGPDSICSKT